MIDYLFYAWIFCWIVAVFAGIFVYLKHPEKSLAKTYIIYIINIIIVLLAVVNIQYYLVWIPTFIGFIYLFFLVYDNSNSH